MSPGASGSEAASLWSTRIFQPAGAWATRGAAATRASKATGTFNLIGDLRRVLYSGRWKNLPPFVNIGARFVYASSHAFSPYDAARPPADRRAGYSAAPTERRRRWAAEESQGPDA